jgi:AcrR family transcriptional regulator
MSDEPPVTYASPAVTPKAAYHHGDLRAQLIAAVRELVETHGPDGFSVAEAARRAGVSSAAPYKHFKDRHEILRGVVSEAMDRLRAAWRQAQPPIPMARLRPSPQLGWPMSICTGRTGGLPAGIQPDGRARERPRPSGQGRMLFWRGRSGRCCLPAFAPGDPDVQRRAYMLWSFVHGHSFLTIDMKHKVASAEIDDWDYLMSVSRAVLAPAVSP